jgi:hypothetical protein
MPALSDTKYRVRTRIERDTVTKYRSPNPHCPPSAGSAGNAGSATEFAMPFTSANASDQRSEAEALVLAEGPSLRFAPSPKATKHRGLCPPYLPAEPTLPAFGGFGGQCGSVSNGRLLARRTRQRRAMRVCIVPKGPANPEAKLRRWCWPLAIRRLARLRRVRRPGDQAIRYLWASNSNLMNLRYSYPYEEGWSPKATVSAS